jgi:S1-C subfamily serine protease
MSRVLHASFSLCARALLSGVLLAGVCFGLEGYPEEAAGAGGLVRVNIISEMPGAKGMFLLNGQILEDYSPIIVRDFPSTGVVIDREGHILAFLGYRWVDVQAHEARIEITAGDGGKWQGKLFGVDQSNGAAVVRLLRGRLRETPVCRDCQVQDGAVIMAPEAGGAGRSGFREARVLSVGTGPGLPAGGNWMLRMNLPAPDISQPILTRDRRVLGFVADRDPLGMEMIVYPISPLLASAEKIIATGGDIRAGWLGLYLEDAPGGVLVEELDPESPALEAGVRPRDRLVRYNDLAIRDVRQFIQLVQDSAVGSRVKLGIVRGGKPVELAARVGVRKPQQFRRQVSLNLPKPAIGLDTVVMTPDLADAMRMPGQTGLLVVDVVKETPAERAGVLAGDVVVAMDGQPIFDAASFATYWQTHGLGERLVLSVLRKGAERTITVEVRPGTRRTP